MKLLKIEEAIKKLPPLTDEIRYREWVKGKGFSTGIVSFRLARGSNSKQIRHPDRDVLCHVVKGRGRLRVRGRRISLKPGMICHIPKGTPHDFAAVKGARLVLFCSVIKTG